MFSKRNQMHLPNQNTIGFANKKRYYFKESLAYTEDHILVTNVCLYNVNQRITADMVSAYLDMVFGKVLKFHLNSSKNKRADGKKFIAKEGFALFESPYSAAKLLKVTVHHINGLRLSVKPNYSWKQPDVRDPTSSEIDTSQPSPIDALNDHCLEHIIRLLSLPDRIHFARTCLRFRAIYKQVSPVLDKSVDLMIFEHMTEWDMRDFFMLSGRFVHELYGTIPKSQSYRFCEWTGIHCTHLKTLDISHTQLSVGNMYKMFVNKDQLQKLVLRNCNIINLYLPNLTKLKILDISHNKSFSGFCMDKLPASIESLTLTGSCHSLKDDFLPKTCKTLPNLKELHIGSDICTYCTLDSVLKQLVSEKCCESLETISLKMQSFDQIVHVAELPNLKKLIITDLYKCKENIDVWFALVKHKSMQLEYLEVRGKNCITVDGLSVICQLKALRTLVLPYQHAIDDSGIDCLCVLPELEEVNLKYCTKVSNRGILRLILACPKLQVLHLQGCELSATLLTDIISKIRQQIQLKEIKRPLPIKLFVQDPVCDEHIIDARDIIDVSLTAPSQPTDLMMMEVLEMELDYDYDQQLDDIGIVTDDMDSSDSFGALDLLDDNFD